MFLLHPPLHLHPHHPVSFPLFVVRFDILLLFCLHNNSALYLHAIVVEIVSTVLLFQLLYFTITDFSEITLLFWQAFLLYEQATTLLLLVAVAQCAHIICVVIVLAITMNSSRSLQ